MKFYFAIQIDCEATQRTINDPALGARAVRGFADVLEEMGCKGTFIVIPSEFQANGPVYREMEERGHEVGLHIHPAEQGYEEFLGVYGFDDQVKIISEGIEIFAECMGRKPLSFTPGYCSANDHTYPVLEALGFKHGTVSLPTRNLPQCACVWGNSPLDIHYPHRYNRCLVGDVDFVDIPHTLDPDSRLWGGAHPQDLRIELVDAKNHWYTIYKSVKRQIASGDSIPVKHLRAGTHNIFDYSDKHNFRRETLYGVITVARQICEQEGCELVPATSEEIAAEYRARVPLPKGSVRLELDTRGRMGWRGRGISDSPLSIK